jgi:two-component system phosphate regulon sensor histidine kinase PhoR
MSGQQVFMGLSPNIDQRAKSPEPFDRFEERSQSTLLNRILMLFVVTILVVLLVPVVSGRETTVDNLDIPSLLAFYALLIGTALINRRYGARPATRLLLTIGAVVTYSAALPDTPSSQDSYLLGVLAAWVILATIFLRLRTAFILTILHGIGIVIFAYTAPMVRPVEVLNGPLLLYVVLTSLVLLLAYQRQQLEKVRSVHIGANELRLRTITETMRDAIFMTDTENRICYATPSAQALFGGEGFRLNDAALRAWLENVHPDDLEDLDSQVITLKDSHSGTPFQYRYLVPGRAQIWVETISSLVRDEQRKPTGMIFVSRNVTERNKAERQRMEMGIQRERFQLFQRFVNDVSHDLRTPLAVMSTSMYLLRKKLTPEASDIVQPHVDSIQNQIVHLEKQLENLTTLSRLQDHGARYHFEAKGLNAPVEQLAKEYETRLAERNIALHLKLTQTPVRIMISEQEFMQALRQIMTNALQYTSEQGTVTIETDVQDKQAIIEISDTGKGIDAKDIQLIFEPLYRVDRARSIDSGGLGLGLSVTRTIIEAHSGSISVESEVGSGTTFSIRVPALLEPAHFYAPATAN